MIRRILKGAGLMVLVACLAAPAWAQRTEALQQFEAGNARYRAGDYVAAVEAYAQAVELGYVSGALYHNLGNAYYRQDALGQAVRYYLRAQRLLPDDRQLQHNLAIVRGRLVDEFAQLPEPFWRPAWQVVRQAIGVGGFFGVGLAMYMVTMGVWGYRIWTGRRRAWSRRVLALAALGALVFLSAAALASLTPMFDRQAVVTAEQSGVRQSPRSDAETAVTVHEGLVLRVRGEQRGWLEVELPNGATGWIDRASIAEV